MSTARAEQITRGCIGRFPIPGTGVPGHHARGNELRLFNVVTDKAGTEALLLGPSLVVDCDVGGPVMPYNPGGGSLAFPLEWLPAHAVVDTSGLTPGGTAGGKYGASYGLEAVTGRVSPQVTRVAVTFADGTVQAIPVNGTFIARLIHPIGWQVPEDLPATPVVRAYDSSGSLLGTAPTLGTDECYKDSSGRVIYGPATDPARCDAALPWRR